MTPVLKNRLINVGIYVSYALIILFFIFPVFWVFSLSLKSIPELFADPPLLFSKDPMFSNYVHVLQNTGILGNIVNSLKLVFFTILFTLLIAVPAAYAFSRFQFRQKKFSLMAILVFQMISPVVIGIPLYRFFSELGMLNNHMALIVVLVAVELPFATWFLKGYFDTIPYELDEAAIVDGCTRMQMIWKVLLPVSMPGITSVSILVAVQSWSQFVIPFMLLDQDSLFPASVGLVKMQASIEAITTHYLAAACIIAILPVITLFIVLQRFIVGALTNGAVKG